MAEKPHIERKRNLVDSQDLSHCPVIPAVSSQHDAAALQLSDGFRLLFRVDSVDPWVDEALQRKTEKKKNK